MSTRFLKKIHGNDVALEESNEEINDAHVERGKQKSFNLFNLLNKNSDNDAESSEHDINDEIEEEEEEHRNDGKTKKKRKKHKKKQKSRASEDIKKDSKSQELENEEGLDEIDKTVRQINKLLGEPESSSNTDAAETSQFSLINKTKEKILTVQHKNLNPYNELKRIFGSRTIQAEQTKPRSRGRTGHLKKTWLVTIRDNMLPISKSGLSMTLDKTITADNVQYFVYEHSSSYRQVQQKFIDAVESLNIENIISIVNTHPYHVDTLLQSAELCKLNEELAMAASLIERALFYLEYAFHPLFNLTTGNCRLDYNKQQNRALFITLFKHLVLVGGRACYRTSLELCKLLLSLEPEEDPLAVVLMIDFYAIRSKEYQWFCDFCNLWEITRNLQQLPNIAYSLALAHFYLNEQEIADEMLQNALIMFPGVLIPLLDKCSINADSKATSHEFFQTKASSSTPPALEKLQNLYVARSFHLWKETDILPWLEKNVHIVLQRVNAKDDYVKFCQVKRNKRYQGKLPRNILRHLIVSDLKDVTVNIQEIQNESPLMSHDPLPPINSIDIYTNPRAARRTTHNNSNLLSLFFSSIFMNLESDQPPVNRANLDNENQGYQNEFD
ncbi:ribosome quality control complex subunit TCF25 [Phymastichus coffea]|uniref:ribosome quality control complex subunit TCF25 n=1 Tax=Phymastichus coffea TaxID=108790 RepID=UPI00273BC169|nr:ribosome quality control complex subunit TCF25 [Phymastichus coffea]